ncbi:Thioredoxin, conserved site [Phytophthora cactorum]|nr:Thioredoxin, conserved site [Phytophthora cactorum]
MQYNNNRLQSPGRLKSILAVQNLVAKIPEQPKPHRLNENDAYRRWIEAYRKSNSLNALSQLDKDAFNAFVKEAGVYLQKQEEEAFQGCNKIGPMEDEELSSPKADAFVEAVKVKLSRHMCTQAAASFELLDRTRMVSGKARLFTACKQTSNVVVLFLQQSGKVHLTKWRSYCSMKLTLIVCAVRQFHLYDVDGNDVVNEAESKLILDSMIATQKAVMTEIFATHVSGGGNTLAYPTFANCEHCGCGNQVDNLPKKREKLFAKSLSEEDFKSKIPEKVRCVFHFANKLDEERKMYDWELFENSQVRTQTLWSGASEPKTNAVVALLAEGRFPELHNLLAVYAKGFYDERYWVVKKSGPAVKIVETAEELEEIKEANDVVVFTVIDAEEGEARTLLEKLADADDLAVYVASTSADVTEDAAAVNKVVLYKKFDEGKVVYDGEFEKESLGEFVKGNSLPLVITFSQEKAPMIFGGEMTEHVLAFVDTSKDYVSGIEAALKAPAKANKGKLLHVIMPSTEKRIVDYFGLKDEEMPAIMLVNMAGSMKKYGFDYKADDFVAKIEDGLTEDLVAFEKSYFEGKLTPLLKSADPEDDSDEAVKVIVGTEFQKRVIDNEKDVLVEFYAPWCGHCKALAPKYEELAEKFADVDSIMVAKMDATANEIDHPGVDVRGFPTILFFPGKDKQNPVVYEGSRDVEGFTEFLKTNAQKFELDGSEHGAEQEQDEDEDNEEQQQEEKKDGAEHEELCCRDYAARRRMVVLPEKKPKKKPDIAVASAKAVQRTQAEILAEQRERVKNLHGVGEKKLKPKAPKRKGPPSKKN